jgi:hypothetical protein
LGFNVGAGAALEGVEIVINTFSEVLFLDGKDCESLVNQQWYPLWMINGPVIVGGANYGNPGPQIPNPGHSVEIRADTNLEVAVF